MIGTLRFPVAKTPQVARAKRWLLLFEEPTQVERVWIRALANAHCTSFQLIPLPDDPPETIRADLTLREKKRPTAIRKLVPSPKLKLVKYAKRTQHDIPPPSVGRAAKRAKHLNWDPSDPYGEAAYKHAQWQAACKQTRAEKAAAKLYQEVAKAHGLPEPTPEELKELMAKDPPICMNEDILLQPIIEGPTMTEDLANMSLVPAAPPLTGLGVVALETDHAQPAE